MICYRLPVFVLGAIALSTTAGSAQADWKAAYSIGDQVQFTISGRATDLQPCTVVENKPGSQLRVRCEAFKGWSAGDYIVYDSDYLATGDIGQAPRTDTTTPGGTNSPADFPAAEWRADYQIGDHVQFTVSGRESDAQPCTVSENTPGSIMRVSCDAFGQWRAGEHVVYDAENISGGDGDDLGRPGNAPVPDNQPGQPGADSIELQLGNWGCWGTGGQIMAGLAFNVLPGKRYSDSAGDEGTYHSDGADIVFVGGILDGERMESLGGQSFGIASQAECNPF